jgi:hypothetical protein
MSSRSAIKDQTQDGSPQLEALTLFPFMPRASWYTEYWLEGKTRGNFISTFSRIIVSTIARFRRPKSAWKKAEGEGMGSTPIKPALSATP